MHREHELVHHLKGLEDVGNAEERWPQEPGNIPLLSQE
jgi:hypothetical protein